MQTSPEIDKISPALVKAQSELRHAVKDTANPAFKGVKYADLSSVWDAAKPVLTANKLAALQDVVSTDAGMGVRTRILHESGQWIEFDPPIIPLEKRNAHGAGSVLTYGRRYSLSAALGVVADFDDDGNAAVASPSQGVAVAHSNANGPAAEFITPDQEEHITQLIKDSKAKVPQFLEFLGVRAIYEIPASQYGQAVNALKAKLTKVTA